MQKYITLLLLTLLLACADKKEERPADVLNREDMAKVLADLHLAHAVVNMGSSAATDSSNQALVNYREYVYGKYKIDNDRFKKSYDFYRMHPVLFDSVYADVITILNNKEIEYRGK